MTWQRAYALGAGLLVTAVAFIAGADWLFTLGKQRSSPELAYSWGAVAVTYWLAYFGWRR